MEWYKLYLLYYKVYIFVNKKFVIFLNTNE